MTRMHRLSWILALASIALAPARAADSLAQIHTPLGDWLLVLFDADKPATVADRKSVV